MAETLREVDYVAAEDTRHSGKLLQHLGITNRLVSFHDHNERERVPAFIEDLEAGKSIALLSDAGTPCVSDPGFHLVRAAAQSGIRIIPIPGACAAIAALAVSGLPTDRFRFEGFVPRQSGARTKTIVELKDVDSTTIFYESPKRLLDTLAVLDRVLPERQIAVARELTKLHEEVLRGTASEIAEDLSARTAIKGEITLLVQGRETPLPPEALEIRRVALLLRDQGLSPPAVRSLVSEILGVAKKAVFNAMKD